MANVLSSCRISQLTELISRKPIPPHVKDLTLEVMAEDEEGEDVEVSLVLFGYHRNHADALRLQVPSVTMRIR